MEQDKLKLILEDSTLLKSVLPKFNSIYKKKIEIDTNEGVTVLSNIGNVSPNDVFTLGGFYGTALFKSKEKPS